jgi:hypothetical protein
MHGTLSNLASLPHRQTPAIIPKTLVLNLGEVVDPLDNLINDTAAGIIALGCCGSTWCSLIVRALHWRGNPRRAGSL